MPKTYHFIDVEQALELMGNDKELYKEVLEMYLKEPQFSNEELQQALLQHDYDKAQKLVHLLKGIAGTLGATKLFEHCKTTDLVFKKKASGNITKLCQELYPLFSESFAELEQIYTTLC
ncbi:MAG: Hpt domain-containing protein [Spirochaetaceae bacterium]|nr:Hpt domain-containing protein [Spirochaetaceae bacterium]